MTGAPASGDRSSQSGRGPRLAQGEWSERGLAGLIGSGATRVGASSAVRAREVSRPTAEDLAAAEQSLVLRRSSS